MKDTTKVIDVELSYQFPYSTSRKHRNWIARLGALYIVAQTVVVLLILLL